MPKKTKAGKNRLDKFYHLAKTQGYRSRASFKLIQLNKKFNFLGKARVLIDLCAAPGSWLQVCAKYMPVSRVLVGVDLDKIKAIPNCITLQNDITTPECLREIQKHVKDAPADVVLHDGAPNVGANWQKDAFSQSELVLASLKLATNFLGKGATFVTKVFRSADYNSLNWVFSCLFRKVTATKPTASRGASAEIFVVCEGYLKPAKIDPHLLDPKFVFKDIQSVKNLDIFSKKQGIRNRSGYDTDKLVVYRQCDVLDFIYSEDPVKILGGLNAAVWKPHPEDTLVEVVRERDTENDNEERELFRQHPKTTVEMIECLKDFRVLSAKDFKLILKWRLAMRDFAKLDEPEDDDEDKQEIILTDEQKDNLMMQEMTDRMRKLQRLKKKKMLKRKKQQAKFLLRQGLGQSNIQDEFDAPTEEGLFNLQGVKSGTLLEKIIGTQGMKYADFLVSQSALGPGGVEFEGSNGLMQEGFDMLNEDADKVVEKTYEYEDKETRDARVEQYLDLMFNHMVRDTKDMPRRKMALKSRKGEQPENLEEEFKRKEEKMLEEYSDDTDDEDPNALNLEPKTPVDHTTRLWFSQGIFEGIDEDEDEGEGGETQEEASLPQIPIQKAVPLLKRKNHDIGAVEQKMDEDVFFGPEERDPDHDEDASEGDDDIEPYISEIPSNKRKRDEYEEVPAGPDVDDFDEDEQAEMLAMGKALLNPTKRAKLLDAALSRYAYPDDGPEVPKWFSEDESKHSHPQIPVTKEEMKEHKRNLRAIDSRSTQKVAEAGARKKKRLMMKAEKAKLKARNISASTELNEREKIKQIQKLYGGALKAKTKTNKVYVVGSSSGRKKTVKRNKKTPGNVKMKLVDKRMKTDKRGMKATKKRSEKSTKSSNKRSQKKKTAAKAAK